MSKSHVSLEQKICPVSGKTFDSGAILFDTRIRGGKLMESMERHTTTGIEISPEVQEQLDKGFVAMVGVDESKSQRMPNGNLNPEGAYRTGKIAYVKKEAAKDIFNMDVDNIPFAYCDDEVIAHLEKMMQNAKH